MHPDTSHLIKVMAELSTAMLANTRICYDIGGQEAYMDKVSPELKAKLQAAYMAMHEAWIQAANEYDAITNPTTSEVFDFA